ncbi:putative ARS binding protein Abp2 [Aspergillus candidus]|uniref:Putative ARS binding protein Abp2 n=1 Tax=Aspergillus candidus TaxID=41067 RepID=A0A2I2FLN8_ASPCN|nr:putative ARS binding protein Abp2 [Aspergillus candidus]PLB41541.1 putative ARS binding protein Abp2 [Aspergillus candidus]
MEGSFPAVMTQPDRNELGGTPVVVQQYARYPPALQPSLQSASSLGSAHSRVAASKSPPLHRKPTPRSLQASPTVPRSIIPAPPATRPGPSMSPPVFDSARPRPMRDSMDHAEPRSLPARDITDETIDDAYVAFVFYCNPNVPTSVDTTELRKTFRCPPRSDGKSFSIFALWELIKRLDSKELKTWIALAIELGVEPPDMEKKQSTQKVQQYAVRLKRWMRAMHVDAFFEYCLGHPHPYYTQLPANDAVVSDSRDGVPLEEDLALRALVPQWKPKRGRKRAEEREISGERIVKRPQLDTSAGVLQTSFPAHSASFPQSAIPFSAFPDEMESHDPWMTAASSFPADGPSDTPATQPGQELRWRPLERDPSPAGYPQSAILPRGHHPDIFVHSAEPRSAVTPSTGEKTRSKRRHGPAVSSAWPTTVGSSTGKTRGRPPNRGTSSGPFSSFPVNPIRSDPSHLHGSKVHPAPAIVLEQDHPNRFSNSQYQQSPTPLPGGGRPNKLQLQVPQHSGAPVRLATPPTHMVNGVNNAPTGFKVEGQPRNGPSVLNDAPATNPHLPSNVPRNSSQSTADITCDDVVRVLSGELLRGRLIGRTTPLSVEESQGLAASVVANMTSSYSQLQSGLPVLMSALHLGLGPHFGYPGITESTMLVRVDASPAYHSATPPTPPVYTISHEYKHGYRFSTKVSYGGLSLGKSDGDKPAPTSKTSDELESTMADLDGLADGEFEIDGDDPTTSEATWKQRYLKLRAQMQKKERSLSNYKRKILESVMADV